MEQVKQKDIFAALIKALGVYFACCAFADFLLLGLKLLQVQTGSSLPITADIIGGLWRLGIAVLLIKESGWITSLAYGKN